MKNICRIKNDIKVSIIIPVFNGERYIEECLNSVENQTYTNVEIIVINDGSTDKTENILLSFQEKFNNIIKITTKNSGAASARNLGMDAAKGEYIMFVDADDILLPNAVEELLIRVQDCSYDIIVTGNEDNSDGSDNSEEMSGEEFYCEMLYEKKFYSVCWGKLYRRDFISKYKFDVAYKIGEDLEFFSRIDFSASNVLYLKKRIYVYRENEQSVTKPVYNENWGKEVALCRRIVETSEGQIRKAAVVRYVRINASCITYAIASQNFTVVKTMKKNIKKFLIQYMLNKRVSVNLKMKIIAKTFLPVWILRLI